MTDHSDVISALGSDWYFLSSVSVSLLSLAPLFISDLQIKMRFMRNQSTGLQGFTWDSLGHSLDIKRRMLVFVVFMFVKINGSVSLKVICCEIS